MEGPEGTKGGPRKTQDTPRRIRKVFQGEFGLHLDIRDDAGQKTVSQMLCAFPKQIRPINAQ